ncbi:chromosome segregation protein SMC [Rhodococcus sp. BP-252]|uniref:chromosome segregation protein SMC n=1 Tax=unclassified Rhodococcus (in: high G+C Gram-positive bacteria) TaxID=192944 RepID=UPI001431E304|nr:MULTISPECIES: chromosome segregation protein SMC [unclassified Rhodococcus (in: high G+C Gram-positive bacteria)]MBY6411145.1 chromosome segregation protein SMC [Rhodococcus sp. BP-320]MBY6415804.1 chromosome segregation protein SMC [Rhodococcus sp. BP-321]MBY6424375.1 chromosome segregation protein SMC [Rhodococcus sp. BP-324]MBY6425869.1 chromosome segregation protein SMC [Rhodococcus sp. BP-323]MBY6431010.1 chromosome segregation protein SMC [Rhodococcus sp. BP-322]
MHLKSLTLKGFKSFASATTLRFEPGITCVVGPNGSGKSNVVDALTWVMGEQGAKALRGGKMEDVIFAGTSGRAPLGRAEVTLTIDNADGALPIDYTEVSITRRMFRDGAGEYEINGNSCRLMDVQELLSDSGIGREMHVIVGQGRLAAILESRPEDRRAFIEEAAGVLKHRKRKEKAVRKLDAMQANLARLTDLTAELRRQLKPLGRQAEVARRAQTVQADLRDAKLRLAADDLVTRREAFASQEQDEAAQREQYAVVQDTLEAGNVALGELEQSVARLTPSAEAASQTWFQLSALAERVNATIRIAKERARHLDSAPSTGRGQDPDELEQQAERVAEEEMELVEAVEIARETLEAAREQLMERESAAAEAERAHMAAVRAVADRREGFARLSGQVDTYRTKVESIDAEVARLSVAIDEARQRGDVAQSEFDSVQDQISGLDASELSLDTHYERAVAALRSADARVTELQNEDRTAGKKVASFQARIEALTMGLERKDGAGWLIENGQSGLSGLLAERITIEPGFDVAIAVAMGPVADAAHADSFASAREAVRALREADGGRAAIVFDGTAVEAQHRSVTLPDGARWALDVVSYPDSLAESMLALLGDVAVVPSLDDAASLVASARGVRAVTTAGDLVDAGLVTGGSDRRPSTLEVQAAIDTSMVELAAAERRSAELEAALSGALAEQSDRKESAEQALAALNESDAAMAAVYEQLGRLGQLARSAHAESTRLSEQRAAAETGREEALGALAELEERLRLAEDEQSGLEGTSDSTESTIARETAAAALAEVRAVEVEARLNVRTAEERAQSLRGRADSLRRAARAEREARARAEREMASRRHAAAVAEAVASAGERVAERLAMVVDEAASRRDELAERKATTTAELERVKEQVRALQAQLASITDAVHRDEVARAQAALRIEQLEASILEQHGIGLDDLIAEYGPDIALPPTDLEMAEYEAAKERGEQVVAPAPMPFDRVTQEKRAKKAERDLATLGKVNPLALEEFAALEERYNFLSTQLEDVKSARKDLLEVVADVDDRILQLFTDAWLDVEREFTQVFAKLFPGGEGRLILTEPGDMLTTGIEVEARPPGKKVKRLSLLSGGEKSLTAVAMLVAIFRARPSPFYVMDEVEAALDDTNLRRLIGLFEQLREKSQLIVITHQKPTMEVADALYGVSMRGDGITTVISQRLNRDRVETIGSATIDEDSVVDPAPAPPA